MSKNITFKENNSALTYQNNGDININPKFVKEFGNIVIYIDNNGDIKLDPQDFVFDCKFEGIAIKIKEKISEDDDYGLVKIINQYLRPYNPKATKKEQKKLDKMIDKIPKKKINELINKIDKQQEAENIINQLRGYFQAEEDERVKDSSMRMLDELEMILKS